MPVASDRFQDIVTFVETVLPGAGVCVEVVPVNLVRARGMLTDGSLDAHVGMSPESLATIPAVMAVPTPVFETERLLVAMADGPASLADARVIGRVRGTAWPFDVPVTSRRTAVAVETYRQMWAMLRMGRLDAAWAEGYALPDGINLVVLADQGRHPVYAAVRRDRPDLAATLDSLILRLRANNVIEMLMYGDAAEAIDLGEVLSILPQAGQP